NAPTRQQATIREFDPVSGEVSHDCTQLSARAQDNSSSTRDILVHESRSLQNDTTAWWLGKLTSQVVVTDFRAGVSLDGTCQLSGTNLPAGSCSGTTPACPGIAATTVAKTQTINYFWNADGSGGGSRQLSHQDLIASQADHPDLVVSQGTVETSTAYQYD